MFDWRPWIPPRTSVPPPSSAWPTGATAAAGSSCSPGSSSSIGTITLAQSAGGENDFTFSTPGSESAEALDLLESRFPARAGDEIDVVFQAPEGIDTPEARAAIGRVLATLGEAPHVEAVETPFDRPGRISPNGDIASATLRLDVSVSDYPLEDAKALVELRNDIDEPGLQVELGGFALQCAEQAEFGSEGIGLLAAAVILLVSFGSRAGRWACRSSPPLFGLGIGHRHHRAARQRARGPRLRAAGGGHDRHRRRHRLRACSSSRGTGRRLQPGLEPRAGGRSRP